MRKTFICVTLTASLALGACQTNGTGLAGGPKATMGGLGGAALGGLVGSQFGGGSGRLIATGAGVLLGALIGQQIGAALDERDQAVAAQASQAALANRGATQIAWNNPQSGNSGSIAATPVKYERRAVPQSQAVTRASNKPSIQPNAPVVPPPNNMEPASSAWQVTKLTNLQAGPGSDYPTVGRIRSGQPFEVIGRLPNSNWLVVAENGRAVGYVNASGAKPTKAAPSTGVAPSVAQPTLVTAGAIDRSSDTTGKIVGNSGLVDRSKVDKNASEEAMVSVDVPCRTTINRVRLKGEDQDRVSEVKFCQQPDGSWDPVSS